MHKLPLVVLVTTIIPGLPGHPSNQHSWMEHTPLAEQITARDPFHNRATPTAECGVIRRLSSILPLFRTMIGDVTDDAQAWREQEYAIDDVLLDHWLDDYWTPCYLDCACL